jgi:hypothetical protein
VDVDITIHKSATMKLSFDALHEAKSLRDELLKWTPNDGWSDNAQEFFRALSNIADDK